VTSDNIAGASAADQDFLTLWKDADADIPISREAKAECARPNKVCDISADNHGDHHLGSGNRPGSDPANPIPRLAAFNLAVTNRITRRFVARLPGLGILTHVGRTSAKLYRTPGNVFRAPERFLIALIYGRDIEWVSNCGRRWGDASLRLAA
jgi:hypothetical protein